MSEWASDAIPRLSALKPALKRLLPLSVVHALQRRGWRRRARRYWGENAVEFQLISALCDPQGVSVDVGGNDGMFTYCLSRFSHSCHVFEPIPPLCEKLATIFAVQPNVAIHQVALSDDPGTAHLRIPYENGVQLAALSTIEPGNALQGLAVRTIETPVMRLDDVGIEDIAFIKIDVEGHELSVLRGAERILRTQRPTLLVEAEERHKPGALTSLASYLGMLGYSGLFYDNGLQDLSAFNAIFHQNRNAIGTGPVKPGWVYINNFIFTTAPDRLRARLSRLE